jgi:TPR repeat protein
LGVCYEHGIGTAPDPVKAFRCYEKTAENGYAPGQNNLGGCYEKGMGVAKDDHAAAEWYARAAVQEVSAACRLGICYEQGRGVEQNLMEAFRLYTYAAEGGNAYAKYRLD